MHLPLAFLRITVPAVLCWASAAAQTLIVDGTNGPGTNFTDLAVAAAAAPDGAVLVVRPGDYVGSVAISGKSLTILADPGARLVGSATVTISGIAANQSVLVRGFALIAPPLTFGGIGFLCSSSAGLVRLENTTVGFGSIGPVSFDAASCAALSLHGCSFSARVRFTNSDASLRNCVVGANAQTVSFESYVQNAGRVQMLDCTVRGFGGFAGSPAVQMNGGSLRLLGTTTFNGGTSLVGSPGLAIAGTGAVRREPGTSLVGGGAIVAPTVTQTITDMPSLSIDDPSLAGVVGAALRGPNGHAGFVLVSLTGPASTVPFLTDALWLDPSSMFVLASGLLGAGGPLTASISLPAVSTALGFQFAWQGVTFEAVAGFQVSNPGFSTVL